MAEVIDPAGFAGWSALMTAIGSIHTNDYFGHLLVFDHKSSRLFPVIADPSGFGVITSVGGMHTDIDIRVPLYEFLTPFLNAFSRVPEFQFQRNLQLYKILQTQLADDNSEACRQLSGAAAASLLQGNLCQCPDQYSSGAVLAKNPRFTTISGKRMPPVWSVL